MNSFWRSFKDLFHLWDQTDREGAIQSIAEGVDFRGSNLWALVIAILIASIGLNLNSTAVIIGAMLISPLMGPILGAGTALGIYDTVLLKRSLGNLLLMTLISLAASTLYFSVTPISGPTSELLARTSPTFFDVLIAALGGTALIIGVSRKSRSGNLLAGVAIATALMPPLCTAGFGLATRNMNYFFGAFYLYMINSVFIGATAFVFAKYLKLSPVPQNNTGKKPQHPVALYLVGALVFITPSLFMAYDLAQESDFRFKVDQFVQTSLQFEGTQVVSVQKTRANNHKDIRVVLAGKPLSADVVSHLKSQLATAGLGDADLKILQGDEPQTVELGSSDQTQKTGTEQVKKLQEELARYTDKNTVITGLTREIPLVFPELKTLSFGELELRDSLPSEKTKKLTIITYWEKTPKAQEQSRFTLWLKLRLHTEDLDVLFLERKPESSHE